MRDKHPIDSNVELPLVNQQRIFDVTLNDQGVRVRLLLVLLHAPARVQLTVVLDQGFTVALVYRSDQSKEII